ncbi:MAG: flagellar protein FlgN [Candidatus Competibacter sp.]|nr:flagellar protein FlgN [Candidatus Competibacter sp.]
MTLATRMRDELGALEGLRDALRQEYDVLRSRDLPGLERAVAEKQRCAERLRELIAARLDEMKQRGIAAEAGALAAYVESLPAAERQEIDALWAALEQSAQQLRAQNEINGAVIAASRNHAERTLAILRGRDSLDFLYDQDSRKVFGGRNRPIAKA